MKNPVFQTRIKEEREKKTLNQRNVAAETGISQSNIAKYETGKLEPNLDTLTALAKFYNVSIDYLLGLIDEHRPLH